MHELESSTSKEDVQAKLGKLAIEREMLQTKLTAEQSVKEHVAEKHDVVIKEKIVHVHHYKNTQHVVATEGYDQSAKLQRPGAAAGSAPIPMVGNTDGFVGATTTRSTFEGVQTDIDPKMQAGITAANRAQHAAEASAAQQTAITSSLTSASHEAQEAARRAQEEAQALRSNVGTMDLEIADLRQQLAAQQQAQESGKPLFTAADVFAESTQIIVAAKASVDDVRTIIADTPALKSHENMKEPCVQLEAAFAKLSEQSKRTASLPSTGAAKTPQTASARPRRRRRRSSMPTLPRMRSPRLTPARTTSSACSCSSSGARTRRCSTSWGGRGGTLQRSRATSSWSRRLIRTSRSTRGRTTIDWVGARCALGFGLICVWYGHNMLAFCYKFVRMIFISEITHRSTLSQAPSRTHRNAQSTVSLLPLASAARCWRSLVVSGHRYAPIAGACRALTPSCATTGSNVPVAFTSLGPSTGRLLS
eukprot:COSAG06_NODE_4306_length_4377_cov_2.143993_2_plen_477_part_00